MLAKKEKWREKVKNKSYDMAYLGLYSRGDENIYILRVCFTRRQTFDGVEWL